MADALSLRAAELLDSVPCGILSFGDDGLVTWANRTLLDMLGFEADEVVGHRVQRLLTVGSRIFYQTHWFPLVRMHGAADEIFLMLRSADGGDVGVLANARRRERDGAVEYDCVVMRLNERQKYEEELLKARRTADTARAEADERRADVEHANAQLEEQTVELELQQTQLEDQATELEALQDELMSANDELLERAEEADRLRVVAEEANRAKSTFLAVMSHELRTPLNAITGYVELLEMGVQGPLTEQQRVALDRIARAERHLLRLINQVLNLARIEAGHVEYHVDDVGVAEVVASVTPLVEPQIGDHGLKLAVRIADDLVARVDREKLEQVLINLIGNAIKFTPEGGSIRVEAERSNGHLELRVADTGIGMAADKLASVFEPFVQIDASRTHGDQGTGLGLAISRDLARGMGGDLTAVSEPGVGSTFTVELPAA